MAAQVLMTARKAGAAGSGATPGGALPARTPGGGLRAGKTPGSGGCALLAGQGPDGRQSTAVISNGPATDCEPACALVAGGYGRRRQAQSLNPAAPGTCVW